MRFKHIPPSLIAAAALAAASFWCSSLWAAKPVADPRVDYRPSKSPWQAISASTAVQLGLRNDPAIFIAREQRRVSEAIRRQSEGVFDTLVFLNPVLEHSSSFLTASQLKNESFNKRQLFRQLDFVFGAVADEIEAQLESGVFEPLTVCQAGEITITIGTETYTVSCPPPSVTVDVNSIVDVATAMGEDEISEALTQSYRRQLEILLVTSRFVAFVGRELLRTTGVVPTIQDQTTLSLTLGLDKLYRNGIVFSPQIQIQALRDNFRGKPLDPTFGGKGVLIAYRSRLGATIDMPLGKGRGVVTTGAPERAAELSLQASLESEAFSMSKSMRNALVAYWAVVAAQERVAVLEASVARDAGLLEIGEALIEAEELAKGDLVFVRALHAVTVGSLETARQLLVQTRLQLASVLGLDVSSLDEAPLAADTFPPLPTDAQLVAWRELARTNVAFERRSDLKAAVYTQESARTLADAAKADLKRRVDLNFSAWYSGLFEDNKDLETGAMIQGFVNAFEGGFTGPSARIALDFDLPFRNNLASGRFLESRSRERRSTIDAQNLRRLISVEVEKKLGAIVDARREVKRHLAAVEFHRQSLEAETELFRYGEATAVNVAQTEETQIAEILALIASRQRLATLVSQLRFELGDLLQYRIADGGVVVEAVRPLASSEVGADNQTSGAKAGG
ncbi:MAG: TolC family protein [Thermoanaerobaculales bacterium]